MSLVSLELSTVAPTAMMDLQMEEKAGGGEESMSLAEIVDDFNFFQGNEKRHVKVAMIARGLETTRHRESWFQQPTSTSQQRDMPRQNLSRDDPCNTSECVLTDDASSKEDARANTNTATARLDRSFMLKRCEWQRCGRQFSDSDGGRRSGEWTVDGWRDG
ncbi:hypothetical protein HJC23_003070 [Cyclotella cryptica]|uniref:Uncharacterized protein n=1 Tax=Cyclotella cryptica TaxID=29204 RepID=A0ABD3PYI8_9STRA